MTRTLFIPFLAVLFIYSIGTGADPNSLPSAQDIQAKAELARQIINDFLNNTFELRLRYEYQDKFLNGKDRDNMTIHAQQTSMILSQVLQGQNDIRQTIENYEGNDWDERYGVTGLWRKLFADSQLTSWYKCRIDYYLALAIDRQDQKKLAESLVDRINDKENPFNHNGAKLLNYKLMMLINPEDTENYYSVRSAVKTLLDKYVSSEFKLDDVYFHAAIFKLKLNKQATADQLLKLYNLLKSSEFADNTELNLKLALAEMTMVRKPSCRILKEVIENHPDRQSFAANLILTELEYLYENPDTFKSHLEGKTVYELALAGQYIIDNPVPYKNLLNAVCSQEIFQTPLLLFAAAKAYQPTNSKKSLEYYIRSATAQHSRPDPFLNRKPDEIAKTAALIAYQMYYNDSNYALLAAKTLGLYTQLAGDNADEKIQYALARLLITTQQDVEARNLLQKISEKKGKYEFHAKMDRILQALKSKPDKESIKIIKKELEAITLEISPQDTFNSKIRLGAIKLYCQLQLEIPDQLNAQDVIKLLGKVTGFDQEIIGRYRSIAYRHLNQLTQAAAEIAGILNRANPDIVAEAETVILEASEKIDTFQDDKSFSMFISDLNKLVEFRMKASDSDTDQYKIIQAEFLSFDKQNKQNIRLSSNIIRSMEAGFSGNIDWLRCHARVLMAQDQYDMAARTWGRIANSVVSDKESDLSSSYRWWRAKYYQLYCWAQIETTTARQVMHAIDVLVSSMPDTHPYWNSKLDNLQKKYQLLSITDFTDQ